MDSKVIKNRILQVLNERGFTVNKLAKGDPALSRKLLRQLTEDTELTISTILLVLEKFPLLRTEWLFRGVGDPFRQAGSVEEQLAMLEERISALEGERKNDLSEDYPAAASA